MCDAKTLLLVPSQGLALPSSRVRVTVILTSSSLIPGPKSELLSCSSHIPRPQPGPLGLSAPPEPPAPPRVFVTSVFLCGLQADFILSQVRVSPPPSHSRAEKTLPNGIQGFVLARDILRLIRDRQP